MKAPEPLPVRKHLRVEVAHAEPHTGTRAVNVTNGCLERESLHRVDEFWVVERSPASRLFAVVGLVVVVN